MKRWCLIVAVVLLSVSSAHAGVVWHFQGEGSGPAIQLSFGGRLPPVYVRTTASVDFTLSAEGPTQTVYFDYFRFSSEPFTAQYTDEYLVDGSFTETTTLRTKVTVDPITVSTKHLGPFLLEANSPYDFSIGEIYDNGMLDPFDQVRLILGTSHTITGGVTVAGPTESLSQTFSLPTSPEMADHPSGAIWTPDFPDSVHFRGYNPNISLGESDSVVFAGTVDDVSFAETVSDVRFVGMSSGLFMYGQSGAIEDRIVAPEPIMPWLLLSAFLMFVVYACLRSRAKWRAGRGKHTPPRANPG